MEDFIGEKGTAFGKAVKDTRDYELHREEKLISEGHVRKGAALYEMTEKLHALLHSWFLSELGLSPAIQRRALKVRGEFHTYE